MNDKTKQVLALCMKLIKSEHKEIELRNIIHKENKEKGDYSFIITDPRLDELKKQRIKIRTQIVDIGINFGCTDYGDEHCLDYVGLIHAIEVMEGV